MRTDGILPNGDPVGGAGFEFDLSRYVDLLRQYWLLIFVATMLGGGVGYIRYSLTPEMYQATVTLQIDRRTLSAQVGGIDPYLESWWNQEYYPTQYRLLQSRGLAERVVVGQRLAEDPRFGSEAAAAAIAADDYAALAALAEQLRGEIRVGPVGDTQLVELSYRSPYPDLAASIANEIADEFIRWGIEDRQETAVVAADFLGDEIEELQAEIEATDLRLRTREAEGGPGVADGGSQGLSGRVVTLTEAHSEAVRERIEKEARHAAITGRSAANSAEVELDSAVIEARSRLTELERRYATLSQAYKPEWPEMVDLRSEIATARESLASDAEQAGERLRSAAAADLEAARRKERQLLSEISRVRNQARDSSSESVELANLERELENRQAQLEGILERRSRSEVESRLRATGESNIRVVDKALVPGDPYQPNLERSLSLGFGGGIAVGLSLALLLGFLDQTLKTADDVEQLVGLATLGTIADMGGARSGYGYGSYGSYGSGAARRSSREADSKEGVDIELVPSVRPRLAVSEAYRSLRAALLLSSAEELRTIVVTSASSGEGKSTTAVNLACVMAQLGRRVLLVDGDLRKPRQHRIQRVSNRAGLVNCLTHSAEPRDVIVPGTTENLFLVPAGPSCPNPSELLGSARMKEVLAVFESEFDLVILDSPPVLAVSDAVLLGSISDGVIFCVCGGKTTRDEARLAVMQLAIAEVRVLGAVLNRYRHRRATKGYRYYQQEAYGEVEQVDNAA